MPVLLVVLLWCVLVALAAAAVKPVLRDAPGLDAVLAANVVLAAAIWLTTEATSLAHALTGGGIAVAWVVVAAVLALCARRASRGTLRASRGGVIAAALLAPLATINGIVAVAAAPNNWDSMTYHLSRVMHWRQNLSVAFYPTHILRQLCAGPLAEMAVLQTVLATGSDRAANLVQLWAWCSVAAASFAIARLLGAGDAGSALAAVAAATIPDAILQSTSTQNDLVVAMLASCCALFLLRAIRDADSLADPLLAGAAAGLAFLTKATAAIYLGPLIVTASFIAIRKRRAQRLAFAALVAIAVNVPHMARNVSLTGNPLGNLDEAPGQSYLNAAFGVRPFVSNVIRNASLQFATGSERTDACLTSAVTRVLGSEAADARTTWAGTHFQIVSTRHEDTAASIVTFLFFSGGIALALVTRGSRIRLVACCVIAAAMLFALLLRWQPWHVRLHIPLLVLAAPAASAAVAARLRPSLVVAIAAALAIAALPYAIANETRPLLGERSVLVTPRSDQYFAARPPLQREFRAAIASTRGCRDVGLITGNDGWEYPLWTLGQPSQRIEHVAVRNASARLASPFRPCAILDLR